MAVDEHLAPSGGFVLIGVDSHRLAAIAAWRPSFAGRSLAAIAADLTPNAAAPIILTGGTLRVHATVTNLSEPLTLTADVTGGDGRPQHLALGTLNGPGAVRRRCRDHDRLPLHAGRLRHRHGRQPRRAPGRARSPRI